MNVPAVATTPTRSAAFGMRGARGPSFREVLASLGESVAPPPAGDHMVVRKGDSLSRICAEQLDAAGAESSPQAVCAAVREVARANHLADPNKIYAGQTLDLSALGTPQGTNAPAQPWQALIEGTAALSSSFGPRLDPFTGRLHQHNGIDLAARAGSAIHALAAGTVIYSGWRSGQGNTVIIRHEDGRESLYGHASKLFVRAGDPVTCATALGCVGSTGHSTGAHLHFEVRERGRALNPLSVMAETVSRVA